MPVNSSTVPKPAYSKRDTKANEKMTRKQSLDHSAIFKSVISSFENCTRSIVVGCRNATNRLISFRAKATSILGKLILLVRSY